MHLLALMGLFADQNVRFPHPFRCTPTSAPAVSKSCCLTKTNKLSNNKTAKNKEIRVFPIFRTVKPFFFEGFIEEKESRYKYTNIVKERPQVSQLEPEYRLTIHSRRALPQLKRAAL